MRFKWVRIHLKVFVLCHYANAVCAYLLYSFFLWSWGVFRDVIPAVHIMCGWLLFAGQRRAFWPVGHHSCGIQQFGHLHGLRRFRRRLNDLQQVSYILKYIYIHIFSSLSFYRSVNIVLFNCSSSWTPQGTHLESNRDDCTVSLVYAVHLMKQGSVSFDYQYVDSNVFFEFFVCFTSYVFQVFFCWSENISINIMFYFWCRFRMTNVRRWTRQEVRNGSNSPLTESGEPIRLGTLFKFKGTVHSQSKIQSSFTPNLYDFLSSAEHQRRYFAECW